MEFPDLINVSKLLSTIFQKCVWFVKKVEMSNFQDLSQPLNKLDKLQFSAVDNFNMSQVASVCCPNLKELEFKPNDQHFTPRRFYQFVANHKDMDVIILRFRLSTKEKFEEFQELFKFVLKWCNNLKRFIFKNYNRQFSYRRDKNTRNRGLL